MQAAIEFRHIGKKYGAFTAVENLNMTVVSGEIHGFLGPNGSGKSTTLRMLLDLIRPTTGTISIFGHDIHQRRQQVMRRIGCIIEKPDAYGYLTAQKNLELAARAAGVRYGRGDYGRLLELVGLLGREQDKVKTYSHGMKQRLGLAQALLHDPDLIILDEPNTGLDPQGIIDLRQLLVRLNQEHGKTILLSSHILSEIEDIAHSMIVLHKGRTVAQGRVKDLLSHEDLHVEVELEAQAEAIVADIQASRWQPFLQEHDGPVLRFHLSRNDIAPLNDFLVSRKAAVLRIEYKRQLEAYFLKMTHN